MFELYVKAHKLSGFINHRVKIEDPDNPTNKQFAHFICREGHKEAVMAIGNSLMENK